MTSDKLKKEFKIFLERSNVNLGRKTSKTREQFINDAMILLNNLLFDTPGIDKPKSKPKATGMDDRVLCIKPKDRKKVLDIGKNVSAMTPMESMRADEQLNRSPFGKGKDKDE